MACAVVYTGLKMWSLRNSHGICVRLSSFLVAKVCGIVFAVGASLAPAAAPATPSYPTLRLASEGPGSATAPVAPSKSASPPGAGPLHEPGAAPHAVLPDVRWCGIESARPGTEAPIPCKYPGLPCGPVSPDQISHGAGEIGEDLDGDGQPDLTLAGRREVPKPEVYAAIYRSTDAGFILADYHAVPPRAEPTMASVVLAAPGSAPLLRDGYDVIDSSGRTVSIARLRRFDGQRFRTLLSFCAHRAEPAPGAPAGLREGHNRIEIVDIDKDGQKDVVLHGLIPPLVFRFTEGGLALIEDSTLEKLYRENSPETQRVKALRAEASRLLESGQVRRAAEALSRAQSVMTYDVDLTLELCGLLLRGGQAEKALELLARLSFAAPEHAAIYCTQARAHRALGDGVAERNALRSCLAKDPDESLRTEATARLRELSQ